MSILSSLRPLCGSIVNGMILLHSLLWPRRVLPPCQGRMGTNLPTEDQLIDKLHMPFWKPPTPQ